jgi:hypothetical protein
VVVIRPAMHNDWGISPKDGDIVYDAWPKRYLNEVLIKDKYERLTVKEIEEIICRVL